MTRFKDVLTTRGRAFVAAGLTLVVTGLGLGLGDLTRIGVLLVALTVLASLTSRRALPELSVERRVRPVRLAVDEVATVEVEFGNTGTRRSPILMAEERVDYTLGDRPRFVLPRMAPGERRVVSYAIRSHLRGRHRLGPLTFRIRDPFGLSARAVALSSTSEVLVLPRVEELTGGRAGGEGVGAEGVIPHMVALHGEDDVAIREYRDGDDLRRIHWPATAHQGELMVRQEDRPARRRAVLVLDSRAAGHRGSGASGSFEWAVSAVASVAVHLANHGYAVHLVSHESVTEGRSAEMIDVDSALEALALAGTDPGATLDDVLHAAHPLTAAGGLVVAVATDHDEELLRQLLTLRQPGGVALLLLLDSASFAHGTSPGGGHAEDLAEIARAAGWGTRVVRSGESIARVWAAVSTGTSRIGVGG
ncbi:DUF58 domain-containing protein [Oryzihumus sp.]|uniref:DUF58 domain-containing protein n=1 Tax=Oryzihumus sp. TaxID=1968903 RepID=UPI002ED7B008